MGSCSLAQTALKLTTIAQADPELKANIFPPEDGIAGLNYHTCHPETFTLINCILFICSVARLIVLSLP